MRALACRRPGATYATRDGSRVPVAREAQPPAPGRPRLLDTVRAALRMRDYSRRTEDAYVAWIRRYILFHGKRHPGDMGAAEVSGFLAWLAVERRVAASTQNQALGALLFLVVRAGKGDRDRRIYTHVLNRGPGGVLSPADTLIP